MWKGLPDREATRALFEKAGLFKTPELREKCLAASEVAMGVLELFLCGVFGALMGNNEGNSMTIFESLGGFAVNDKEKVAQERADQLEKVVSGLQEKVAELERQLRSMQRHTETQMAMVSQELRDLKKDVSEKAGIGALEELSDDVSRMKVTDRGLYDRLLYVGDKAQGDDEALRDEFRGMVEKLKQEIKTVEVQYNKERDPMTGIIALLQSEWGFNVHRRGVINVTASSSFRGRGPECAAMLNSGSQFCSRNERDQWICYDFKEMRVMPTSYSIRSSKGCAPKSWAFEVSETGEDGSWKTVDTRADNRDLLDKGPHNYTISNPPQGNFRFVRLRHTGRNHDADDYRLILSAFEVFGTVYR